MLVPVAVTLSHMLDQHLQSESQHQPGQQQQPGHPISSAEQLHTVLSLIVFIGGLSSSAANGKSQVHSQDRPEAETAAFTQQAEAESEVDVQSQKQPQLDTAASRQQADDETNDLGQAAQGQSQAVADKSDGVSAQAVGNGQQSTDSAQEAADTLRPDSSAEPRQQACQAVCLQVITSSGMFCMLLVIKGFQSQCCSTSVMWTSFCTL